MKSSADRVTDRYFRRRVLYPDRYAWFVFVSALDVLLTWTILLLGGREVNSLARLVIDRADLPGVVVLKFTVVGLVVIVCEYVGRRCPESGRRLATWAVILPATAVMFSCLQLVWAR